MLRTALLAAAAAFVTSAPAMAQTGGHVGAGFTDTDASSEAETWQVEGAFGGSTGAFGFQLDGSLGNVEASPSDVDTMTLAGHLYFSGANWRLGGVVAHTSIDGGGADADETVYGVEGTFNLGPNAVLLGSYTIGETEFIADLDTWNADVGLNIYASDNLRFGGYLGFGNLDGGGGDVDTTSYGIGAEWQFSSMPVSLRLGWDHFEIDGGFDDSDSVTIGARWNFGGTLRDRDNATPFNTRTSFYQRIFALQ